MRTVIQRHNKRILSQHAKQNQHQAHEHRDNQTNNRSPECNCHNRSECPMAGKCLAKSVVYEAEVKTTTNDETNSYIGVTANNFKDRSRNLLKSFQHTKYANNTELSKHIWKLKDNNRAFTIKWSIIKRVPAYRPGSRRCNLCLEEKLLLMKGDQNVLLNKRNELFARCRHVTKHQLK